MDRGSRLALHACRCSAIHRGAACMDTRCCHGPCCRRAVCTELKKERKEAAAAAPRRSLLGRVRRSLSLKADHSRKLRCVPAWLALLLAGGRATLRCSQLRALPGRAVQMCCHGSATSPKLRPDKPALALFAGVLWSRSACCCSALAGCPTTPTSRCIGSFGRLCAVRMRVRVVAVTWGCMRITAVVRVARGGPLV